MQYKWSTKGQRYYRGTFPWGILFGPVQESLKTFPNVPESNKIFQYDFVTFHQPLMLAWALEFPVSNPCQCFPSARAPTGPALHTLLVPTEGENSCAWVK